MKRITLVFVTRLQSILNFALNEGMKFYQKWSINEPVDSKERVLEINDHASSLTLESLKRETASKCLGLSQAGDLFFLRIGAKSLKQDYLARFKVPFWTNKAHSAPAKPSIILSDFMRLMKIREVSRKFARFRNFSRIFSEKLKKVAIDMDLDLEEERDLEKDLELRTSCVLPACAGAHTYTRAWSKLNSLRAKNKPSPLHAFLKLAFNLLLWTNSASGSFPIFLRRKF